MTRSLEQTAPHRTASHPPTVLHAPASGVCSCQRTVKFIYSKASNHTITEHWGAHVTLRAVEINATLLTRPTTRAPSRSHTLAANHHIRTRLISIRRRYPRHAWAHVYIGIGTAPWAAIGKDASQGTGARMMLTAQTQTRDRQLRTLAQQRRVRFTNTHTRTPRTLRRPRCPSASKTSRQAYTHVNHIRFKLLMSILGH